jgi:ABC-type xylose transport system substrate-binding protein
VQSCEEAVGFTQQNRKRWMSDETWFKVNVRRAIKEKLMNATTRQEKKTLQDLYSTKDKEVKL